MCTCLITLVFLNSPWERLTEISGGAVQPWRNRKPGKTTTELAEFPIHWAWLETNDMLYMLLYMMVYIYIYKWHVWHVWYVWYIYIYTYVYIHTIYNYIHTLDMCNKCVIYMLYTCHICIMFVLCRLRMCICCTCVTCRYDICICDMCMYIHTPLWSFNIAMDN